MKRHLTPILLLLVAIGLGVWLWLDRNSVTEGERKRRENNVFTAWRREELTKIEIAHEGETIVLVRDAKTDSSWRMTSPRAERVDQAAAERLLTTLEFATVVRKVGDETATLGFEAPRATGSVSMGALVIRFALGGPSPRPEGSSYFKVDDGIPFVASRELTEALLARSDSLRDRTVIPYLSLELARFELKHPPTGGSGDAGGFVIERSDARSFKVRGLRLLASRQALDRVWGALAEMRAEAFPKDADADRLTQDPRLVIYMTPKDTGKPPGELVVGEACPGHPNDVVVLRKQPTRVAACAPKGALDALLGITPALLVDKRPFAFRSDEVEELRLERLDGDLAPNKGDAGEGVGPPRALEIARRGTGFHQREPVDRELTADEAEAASELLTRIDHATAVAVQPGGAPYEAIARARVHSGEYDETVEVLRVPPGSKTALLRRVSDDARLTVTPEVARRLIPHATSFRPLKLLGESRGVKRVLLKCGTTQELIDDGAGLKLVEPRGYETDGSIVQLVDGLLTGKVIGWAADADDGTFGIGASGSAEDNCRVVVSFTDGNAPVTVRFGAEAELGFYASIDGRPEVFVLSNAMHELAKRIYVSHASLRADPSQIESVRVLVMGKPAIGRDPATLREAASGLFADRVVTLTSSDVGRTEVEIEITLSESPTGRPAEGGSRKKKIVCGPIVSTPTGAGRRCATPGVKAVFEVPSTKLGGLLTPAPVLGDIDASVASDAATR